MKHVQLFEAFLKGMDKGIFLRLAKSGEVPQVYQGVTLTSNKRVSSRLYKDTSVETSKRDLYEFPNKESLIEDTKYMQGSVTQKDIRSLIELGFIKMHPQVDLTAYDLILTPQSTSLVLDEIMNVLLNVEPSSAYGPAKTWNPQVIRGAFTKRTWNEVEWDMELIDRLSNSGTKNEVLKLKERLTATKGGEKAKLSGNVIPRFRKFLKQFMDITPEALSALAGRKVIILDDFVTDGATRRQMQRLAVPGGPQKILNLALFHVVGYKQEDDE
jgi:hypothetical protein